MLRLALVCLAVLFAPLIGAGELHAQVVIGETGAPDYSVWEETATRVEQALETGAASSDTFAQLRRELEDWRDAFLTAQGLNSERIATLRDQITALGAVPGEGETEPAEISERRSALQDQLNTALAPVRRAEEAYTRADGLIDQIDALVRERQTEQTLALGPSPLNPVNWPQATLELTDIGTDFTRELAGNYQSDIRRTELRNNLPVILILLVVGLGLILRAQRWTDRALEFVRMQDTAGRARFRVGVFVLSLVAVALPVLGLNAFIEAVDQSQLFGRIGDLFLGIMTYAVLAIFAARWIGRQVFPAAFPPRPIFDLDDAQNRAGRFACVTAAIVLTANYAISALTDQNLLTEIGRAIWSLPIVLVGGLTLYRLSRLLRIIVQDQKREPVADREIQSDPPGSLILSFLRRAALVTAIVGPLLGAVGYMTAGLFLVKASLLTLGLLALVAVLQRFARDVVAIFIGDDRSENALVPVLINFALTIAALPVVALIWGARGTDLREAWTWVSNGFQIGNSRISPVDFLTFAVVFGIGYMLTRLFQGTLKTQVLPKTRIDTGGRNAIVSGTGYIGIFLAALIAITTAGIDLSSLAIVAGALSVGIGFGLQTIVSNFVSGIILLIERPISEGDWIEVGGTMGVVRDISVRATRIETFDRRDVIVPNADLISTSVTNWTKGNLTGRIIVPVGVAYGSDTRQVEAILLDVAKAHPVVILSPPPSIVFSGFGADSLDFEIRAILRDVNYALSAQSDMRHEIIKRFEQEGIEIPFMQRDVWLRNPEALSQGPAST